MKINKYLILVALIPFLVDFRYTPSWTTYPVVLLIAIMGRRKIDLLHMEGLMQALFLIVVTGVFRYKQYSIPMIKDLGLLGIGLMPFLLNAGFRINIRKLNVLLIIGFIIATGSTLFNYQFSVENFINSTFGIERGASTYTFGLAALYWARKKEYRWVAIDVFFMFLGGKRVAMVAIFACLLVDFFLHHKKGNAPWWTKLVLFGSIVLFLHITFQFTNHVYDDFILFNTGHSADSFTMGRQQLYSVIISMIPDPNYWGIGPGNTLDSLREALGQPRMHNDILKIYAENGVLIFCVFFYLTFRKMQWNQIPTLLFIFSLYTSTNTLIYVYMIFMYGVFLRADDYFYDIKENRRKHFSLERKLLEIEENERNYDRGKS